MGVINSSLTPLNCILENWDRFDPQGLKKTHLAFLCDTACLRNPLEDGEQWPVGGSLKYNTVLQIDRFCRKQVKWVEVTYVLPFFSLWNMPELSPKGIDLGVKPSAPSCPPTLPQYPGLPTEQTESQRTPKKDCPGLSKNPNWDSNCSRRGPNSSCLSTTSDYSGFNRNSDDQRKRWEGQETKRSRKAGLSNLSLGSYVQSSQRDWSCCLFMKHPLGEIISLWELISLFLIKKHKEPRRI